MSDQDFMPPGEPPEPRVVTRWTMQLFPLTADLPYAQLMAAFMVPGGVAPEEAFIGVLLTHPEHGPDYRRGSSGPIGEFWKAAIETTQQTEALPEQVRAAVEEGGPLEGIDPGDLLAFILRTPIYFYDAERIPQGQFRATIADLGCSVQEENI